MIQKARDTSKAILRSKKAQHPKEVLTRFWANKKIKDFKIYCIFQ